MPSALCKIQLMLLRSGSRDTYRSIWLDWPVSKLALQARQVPVDKEPSLLSILDANHDVADADVAVQNPSTLQDLVMG